MWNPVTNHRHLSTELSTWGSSYSISNLNAWAYTTTKLSWRWFRVLGCFGQISLDVVLETSSEGTEGPRRNLWKGDWKESRKRWKAKYTCQHLCPARSEYLHPHPGLLKSLKKSIQISALEVRSEVLQNMYNKLRAIQTGDEADVHGWMRDIVWHGLGA